MLGQQRVFKFYADTYRGAQEWVTAIKAHIAKSLGGQLSNMSSENQNKPWKLDCMSEH